MKFLSLFFLSLILPLISFASEIHIHSNGDLKPILNEITHYHQTRNASSKVIIQTGKVAEIKDRLEAGAPADLLIGDDKLFEMAEAIQAIDPTTVKVLFSDPVVAVTDMNSEIELTDPKELNSENFKKIALLNAKNPFGKLVRTYLEPRGLKDIPAEKKVDVADIKSAFEAVKNGEAKWTFVYSSDSSRRKFRRLFQVPISDIPPVKYSMAMLKKSTNKQEAIKFMDSMQSTIGKKFFENAGYLLPGQKTLAAWTSPSKPKKEEQSQTQKQGTQTQQTQTQTQETQTQENQTQSQTQTQTQSQPTQSEPQTQTQPQTQQVDEEENNE
jgi:molybdenum ABC transporter molybdate-binding protein